MANPTQNVPPTFPTRNPPGASSPASGNTSGETPEVSPQQGSMAPRQVIGTYKDPKAKAQAEQKRADKRADEVTAAKSLVEGVTSEMEHDVEENKDSLEKAKSYDEILEENDISHSKATAIIDDLLSKGFYEEDMPITQSAYVTLRTRTQSDYRRYLRALEIVNPKFMDEQREIQMRYFIAASLVHFKGQSFEHPELKTGNDRAVEAAFDARLAWLNNQPEVVVTLIGVKLSKFDRMIQVVTSEGVIENF